MVTSMSPALTTTNTMAIRARAGARTAAPMTRNAAHEPRANPRTLAVPNRSHSPPPTALAVALPARLTESRRPKPPVDSPSPCSMSMAATAQPPQNTPKSTKTQAIGRKVTSCCSPDAARPLRRHAGSRPLAGRGVGRLGSAMRPVRIPTFGDAGVLPLDSGRRRASFSSLMTSASDVWSNRRYHCPTAKNGSGCSSATTSRWRHAAESRHGSMPRGRP